MKPSKKELKELLKSIHRALVKQEEWYGIDAYDTDTMEGYITSLLSRAYEMLKEVKTNVEMQRV